MMTFASGAAAGAGAMYLLDPEHGPERRRDAQRSALRRARSGASGLVVDVRRRAVEVIRAAVGGYEHGRRGESVVVQPPRSVWRRMAG